MNELIAGMLILLGSFAMLVGALALLRFPDVYSRAASAGVATTIGFPLILLGLCLYKPENAGPLTLIALFLFISFPLGVHAIAHTAKKRQNGFNTKPEE